MVATESAQQAIDRLVRAAPSEVDTVVMQVSPSRVVVTAKGKTAVVDLHADRHEIVVGGVDTITRQESNQFFGAGANTLIADMTGGGRNLLGGESVEFVGILIREPATGKWEPQLGDDVGAFIYDNLVLQGWHQKATLQSAKVMILAFAIAVPVLIVLIVGGIFACLV